MVAGLKGVAFLDDDEMVTSSSTENEVYLISKGGRKIVGKASLGKGKRIESLCAVPGTKRVLVADGDGTVCDVDFAKDPPTVNCVATSEHFEGPPPRLTSVAAWDESSCFVAGAIKDEKYKCSVRHVDLKSAHISEATVLDATMIRALLAEKDKGRLLVGVVQNFESARPGDDDEDGSDDKALEAKHTDLVALYPDSDVAPKTLATVDFFVHVIAKHPKEADTYVLLRRHSANASTPVAVVVRLAKGGGKTCSATKYVATLQIEKKGTLSLNSYSSWMAYVFGYRAGREHALAVCPDGEHIVTGCVHKSSKGILQVWGLEVAPPGETLPPSGCLP